MWISDLAIRRPIVAVVAMLVLALAGMVALRGLETDEWPDVQAPMVTVTVPYPGATPAEIERELLRPLEDRVRSVAGLKKLKGTAGDGYALLFAEFVFSKAPSEAIQEVRDAVSAARGDLPREVEEPVIERFSETDLPVLTVAVGGSGEPLALGADARRLARALRGVPGVAQVRVVGDAVPELSVHVRPEALRAVGITLAELTARLESQNVSVPIGRLEGRDREATLRFQGRPANAADFGALPLATSTGQVVRLRDVADVRVSAAERRGTALVDGRAAVTLEVRKRRGASATTVADELRARMAALQTTLPAGRTVRVIQDAGRRTALAVGDVQKTLLEGALLTVLVVFVFLNSWRSTVITGLALPVSVLASFMAVWAFGFKLETMSLLGLSLAIGILIDDAIVVRENIVRHVEMGKDHVTASRDGTREIGLAVLATTAAIVVVFVPVGFMNGLAGQYFKPFALTIACAVLVSLFVSFSLDPMLSAYWPDPHVPVAQRAWLSRVLHRFNSWFDGIAGKYRAVIAWALRHRSATMGAAFVSLVVAALLPATGLVGAEFLPEDDRGEVGILVEAPPGASLAYTTARAEAAAAIARRLPEVRTVYTTVGGGEGDVSQAQVLVLLSARATRDRTARQIATALRDDMQPLRGATFAVMDLGGNGFLKPIQLQVRGTDASTLPQVAASIAARVRTVPGAVDVSLSSRPGAPAVDIGLQRALSATMGLTPAEVASAMRVAFAGVEAGRWLDNDGELRKVRVQLPSAQRQSVADLGALPLQVPGPDARLQAVPFAQVATATAVSAPTKIEHEDGAATVTLTANVLGRPLGDVANGIDRVLSSMSLPPGVTVAYAGDVKDQQEVFSNILLALAAAVVGMYFVLVLQFNSWIEPLAILTSLPLSAVGVVGALWMTGMTINIMSLIGVILLCGVVAKNAILLLDYAKQLREGGWTLTDALVESGATRLRPIVMTTVALVAGMVPVAIGSGEGAMFRAPLGVAVIGGTITSTALTLLVVPVVYALLDRVRERVRSLSATRSGQALEPTTSHGPLRPEGLV
ncbi:efflux RND transporter permease subunit [Gemmatimonas sp.]|uniref:efflux RND transporter permease subunit n=1 Tax=Gemmatimonas sp. TaxID=1962908 RepID=UPI003DA1D049